ncbi:MAG: hypothetical protein ACRDHZ_24860, partial [Ktedonobacteraceae bacterium]
NKDQISQNEEQQIILCPKCTGSSHHFPGACTKGPKQDILPCEAKVACQFRQGEIHHPLL